jgi:hypothetical protein
MSTGPRARRGGNPLRIDRQHPLEQNRPTTHPRWVGTVVPTRRRVGRRCSCEPAVGRGFGPHPSYLAWRFGVARGPMEFRPGRARRRRCPPRLRPLPWPGAKATTSSIGWRVARPTWTTWPWSAGPSTGRSTRAAGSSPAAPTDGSAPPHPSNPTDASHTGDNRHRLSRPWPTAPWSSRGRPSSAARLINSTPGRSRATVPGKAHRARTTPTTEPDGHMGPENTAEPATGSPGRPAWAWA